MALSAFNVTVRPAGSAFSSSSSITSRNVSADQQLPAHPPPSTTQPPPPLVLSDLVISTPSCHSLSLHQAFACAASPSPNFTVTPTALIVHSYTTPTASISNVTLTCNGRPPPPLCTALRVSTGAELLRAVKTMDALAQLNIGQPNWGRAVAFVFLERDITLTPPASGEAAAFPPSPQTQRIIRAPSDASPAAGPALTLTRAGAEAAAAQHAPVTLVSAKLVLAGASDGNTVLDLAGTAGLVTVVKPATVQIHNLTLRNPPLGLPDTYPWGLFRLGIWTFSFRRRLLGRPAADPPPLLLRNVRVWDVPPEEVASYGPSLLNQASGPTPPAAPPGLAPCHCAMAQGLFVGKARWVEGAVPYMKTDSVETVGGSLQLDNVRVCVPAAAAAPSGADTAADAGSRLPDCLAGLVCQLVPERAPSRPWVLNALAGINRLGLIFLKEQRFDFAMAASMILTHPYNSLQAEPDNVLPNLFTLLGEPLAASVLDIGFMAPAVCLRGPRASITLRHVVLLGLPPAGDAECILQPPAGPMPPPLPPPPRPLQPQPQPQLPLPPQGSAAELAILQPSDAPSKASAPPGAVVSGDILGRKTLAALAAGDGSSSDSNSLSSSSSNDSSNGSGSLLEQSGGTAPGRRQLKPARRLLQVIIQGLDPSLANFTSCLWPLDFDRVAASAAKDGDMSGVGAQQQATSSGGRPVGLPYVFLDSVTLVIPQPELDFLVWTWAHNSTAAATEPALADQLRRMLAGSQLSAASRPVLAEALSAATSAATDTSSGGVGGRLRPPVSRLTFAVLWWCGLEGRNVTLSSQLPDPSASSEVSAAAAAATHLQQVLQLELPVAYPQLLLPWPRPRPMPPPPVEMSTIRPSSAQTAMPSPTASPSNESFTDVHDSSAYAAQQQQQQQQEQQQQLPGPAAASTGGHGVRLPLWAVSLLAFGATCAVALVAGGVVMAVYWRRRGGVNGLLVGGNSGVDGDGDGDGDGGSDGAGRTAGGITNGGRAASSAAAIDTSRDAAKAAAGLSGGPESRGNGRTDGSSSVSIHVSLSSLKH